MRNLDCTCLCEVDAHKSNGCETWFGDRNTGFQCSCDWRGNIKPATEKSAVVTVKSTDNALTTLHRLLEAARREFGASSVQGFDRDRCEQEKAQLAEERNAAVAAYHEAARRVHYCEIHVTVRGITAGDERLGQVDDTRWWYSKVSTADFDDPKAELIYTTRAISKEQALLKISNLVKRVAEIGGQVTRSKVEEVTFDTKYGDVIEQPDTRATNGE